MYDVWLTCEGFEGCQVVAIQHVNMAGECQVLAEAATPPRSYSQQLNTLGWHAMAFQMQAGLYTAEDATL